MLSQQGWAGPQLPLELAFVAEKRPEISRLCQRLWPAPRVGSPGLEPHSRMPRGTRPGTYPARTPALPNGANQCAQVPCPELSSDFEAPRTPSYSLTLQGSPPDRQHPASPSSPRICGGGAPTTGGTALQILPPQATISLHGPSPRANTRGCPGEWTLLRMAQSGQGAKEFCYISPGPWEQVPSPTPSPAAHLAGPQDGPQEPELGTSLGPRGSTLGAAGR